MLFKVQELVQIWNCNNGAVLHVGAHLAEELEDYSNFGFEPITWVEAQPELARELEKKLDSKKNTILNFAAWDTNGEEKTLQITNNSQSSSLLNLKTHLKMYPDVKKVKEIKVEARRLDSVISPEASFALINIDVQGAELNVLRGLGEILRKTEVIYCEVNRKFLYEDCSQVHEIDSYLETFGFKRVATRWYVRAGWGDAIYQNIKLSKRDKKQFLNHLVNQFNFYKPQAYSLMRKFLK